MFIVQQPEGIGADKYDETAGALIAQRNCGLGVPSYRLEKLEGGLGIPMPAATQRVNSPSGRSPTRFCPILA